MANKTDYTKPSTDLIEFLPEPLRSDVNLSLFNNVFNRYLTKLDIEKVAGYIGRGNTAAIRPRQIHEQDVHRQAYQLQPIPYNKIGTIEHMTSWKDMQNELERLGVDIDAFSEWGATQKFNWVPPIDINKIINYRDYYWVDPEDPNSIPQYITIRSTCATATAKFNFWNDLIEQHGATFQISEILATDATPVTYTITEFIDTPDSIKVEGDITSDILLGDFIDVIGTVNNDDTYRITATPTYSGITNETLLVVDKPIVADTPAATAEVASRRFDKLVLPANTTLVGSPPVAVTDLGNYTSLFVEGFIFFIRNSTNVDLSSTFVETISSTYDADSKETTVTINHRVTDDTADGEISLEEQFSIFEADMNCQCDNFGGWDVSPWDDNPLEPLWGDNENADGVPDDPDGISDHTNLITRISHTTPPVYGDGIEGELWYDTTANILYQNSALPLTETNVETFVVPSGSPITTTFELSSSISTGTIVTAERTSGSPAPINLNISYTADGVSTTVTVLDTLDVSDIIEITYERPTWAIVWRNFSIILDQTTGITLWDDSLSCDTRPRIDATEQWISQNKWFHKNDVVNFTSVQRANQPIIEYDWDVELNEWTYINYNWAYRRIITETFESTTSSPPRIELEKLIWWEHADISGEEIIFDDRYGDLTDYFIEGRTVFFVEGLVNVVYTVVESAYKTADAVAPDDEAFPYRTYVTFDKRPPELGSPALAADLSSQIPNAVSIIPTTTLQGDTWKDYGIHWLFVSADDSVPAPHQSLNPFIDIDVLQIPVQYSSPEPVVPFAATLTPVDFVQTNTVNLDANFKVDWGDGTFVGYAAGTDASSVASGNITVESDKEPAQVRFTTDSITDIDITESSSLTNATDMCVGLTNLATFNIADASNITSFAQAWESCSALITFPLIDTSLGTNFIDTFRNCTSLVCLRNLNTTLVGSPPLTAGLFTNTPVLIAPDGAEQITLLSGFNYVNPGDCPPTVAPPADSSWDISTASFPNAPLSLTEGFWPSAFSFGNNGFKLYTAHTSGFQPIYEYDLSSAYDVKTATYNGNFFDTSSIPTDWPTGIRFSTDGTILIIGGNNGDIDELLLSPAWDISSATSIGNISGFESDPIHGIHFSADGLKMAIMLNPFTDITNVVNTYTLTTAFRPSLGISGVVSTVDVNADDFDMTSVHISPDGLAMYSVGQENDQIYQYTLSSSWDVSTANVGTPLIVDATFTNAVEDLAFNPTGTEMYLLDGSGLAVYPQSLDTAWTIETFILGQPEFSQADTSPQGLTFSPDGTDLFVAGADANKISRYSMGTGYDIVNAAFTSDELIAEDASIRDVAFDPTGTKMYVLGATNNTVYQYAVSPPWDVASAIDNTGSTLITTSEQTNPRSMYIGDDGFKCYIFGNASVSGVETVHQYNLGTAYDMTTASYSTKFKSVEVEVIQSGTAVTFKPDGTIMYVFTPWSGEIYQYALGTAWDVSTANYDNKFYVSTEEWSLTGLVFSPDGHSLFTVGTDADIVREYSIDTV